MRRLASGLRRGPDVDWRGFKDEKAGFSRDSELESPQIYDKAERTVRAFQNLQ